MITRAQLEQREASSLEPWASRAAQSRGRRHAEPEHPYRTAFQRDRDRIIHCSAFRRLQYKTQVFVNHEGDYYRTRLTHTMEAAQIARTIARAVAANEDLAEAIVLSHDLGHTPFGHAGQEALDALLRAVRPDEEPRRFEHNRQSLRIVDHLEQRYPGFDGLNLSYEVREAIAKHSRASAAAQGGGTGSAPSALDGIDLSGHPTVEAQIADVSDSLAYDHHDLDDGMKSGLLLPEQMEGLAAYARGREAAGRVGAGVSPEHLRAATVRAMIDAAVGDVLAEAERRIARHAPRTPDAVRALPVRLVGFSDAVAAERRALQAFLHTHLYGHYRVRRMQEKAKRFLEDLFREYVEHPEQLPPPHRDRIAHAGVKQVVADYIAGMTDRFAQDEYRRLFLPFERV